MISDSSFFNANVSKVTFIFSSFNLTVSFSRFSNSVRESTKSCSTVSQGYGITRDCNESHLIRVLFAPVATNKISDNTTGDRNIAHNILGLKPSFAVNTVYSEDTTHPSSSACTTAILP